MRNSIPRESQCGILANQVVIRIGDGILAPETGHRDLLSVLGLHNLVPEDNLIAHMASSLILNHRIQEELLGIPVEQATKIYSSAFNNKRGRVRVRIPASRDMLISVSITLRFIK